MLNEFEKWLNPILDQPIPDEVVSFVFNIYEDANSQWSVELVGCGSFDEEDEDWCCDEVTDFGSRNKYFGWKEERDWQHILEEVRKEIDHYLESGKNGAKLKSKAAVGVGFVDGDLYLAYRQKSNETCKPSN